jgi:hypothetical protein
MRVTKSSLRVIIESSLCKVLRRNGTPRKDTVFFHDLSFST